MSQTFLQVAQAQGGHRFGPFTGIVQIGSHPQQCQVLLQGLMPVHCQVMDNGNGTWTVTPTDRNGQVFLIQAGDQQLWPVQAPVIASPGDTLVLGSQQGARLTVLNEQQVQASAPPPSTAQKATGFAGSMQKELSRQAHARLMHRNRWYRDFYNYSYRLRSGSLTNPRVLVPLIGGVLGAIGTGFVACAGGVLALLQLLSG